MQLIQGILLGVIIAWLAYRARSLDKSGALAAALVGSIIFGLGGWQWATLLLTFFVTSSALSRAFRPRKQELREKFSKGDRRDAGQVFGNGALPAFFAALHFASPDSVLPWVGFAAALAAVNADTWATELGVLNPGPPRLITDLRKRVEKGTSGGVSLPGTAASFLGSALIAWLAVWISPAAPLTTGHWIVLTLAGIGGALFDSFLGATVQAMYYCPADQKETEKHPLHTCGTPTVHLRGWWWLNNDWVNFACGAFGAVVAILILVIG